VWPRVRGPKQSIEVANLSLAGTDNPVGPCIDQRQWWRVRRGAPSNRIDKVHQRICRLVAMGVTVVAAAGNDATDAATYTPAAYEEVIAVSAIADFDGNTHQIPLVDRLTVMTAVVGTVPMFSAAMVTHRLSDALSMAQSGFACAS
jgi:subtilisin family serine protease